MGVPSLEGCHRELGRRFAFTILLIMSLQEASDARKARLVALRKRKAGEATDEV